MRLKRSDNNANGSWSKTSNRVFNLFQETQTQTKSVFYTLQFNCTLFKVNQLY